MVVHQSANYPHHSFPALSAQQLMPAPQTAANSEDSAPMVAEFHRRIAALIKIQDEMKAQSGFKELGI